MALMYDQASTSLDDSRVDNIADQSGVIDQLPSLTFAIDDRQIIKNLDLRIKDSDDYWNKADGFNLSNSRNNNVRMHLNQIDEAGLYQHQRQYKENQLFVAEESIVSYVTSQVAGPLVIPASNEQKSKLFAGDLEKAINCHNEDVVDLEGIVELSARNILNKRVSIIKLYYDKTHGQHGEILSEAIDPEHVILDKNTPKGGNPGFICHILKRSTDELIAQFPTKEKEILGELGIQRKTAKQMTAEHAVREVWVTHYDDDGKPCEGVVWYMGNLVLEKIKNPNYLYAKENLNLLKYPKKPFIFGNLVNYGTHLIDSTTPLEQAAEMQKYLNRRGRQIAENADKANGVLIISTQTGLSKDDGEDYTGDPNQKIFINTQKGESVDSLVKQLQAQNLPDYVLQDKQDARMQVGNIMGAPTDFTGSQADDGDPTLGEVMIKKNQAAGRQDMMVRAITRMLGDYYEYLVQMMIVWYTEPHSFTHDNGNGDFDYITLKRGLIEDGIRVKSGKPANPDRSRIEAMALKLYEQKGISLLDTYRLLQLDNPQQLYDNWAKQQADPMALARDALDVVDESEAYVAYVDIMDGKQVEPKQNPTKEYILSLRKLMINDDFLHAPKPKQRKFMDYVSKCIDSFETLQQLDEASKIEDDAEPLRPEVPLPPLGGMPQPGMPPAPGQGPMPIAGPPGPMPQPGMPPMNGIPSPMPPAPSSIFAGTPLPTPGQAPMPQPTNPASLPMA